MRRFQLDRIEDESGVSGTGIVAEGAVFATGACVLVWLTKYHGVSIFPSVDEMISVHGHGGKTVITWIDEPSKPTAWRGENPVPAEA